MALRPSSGTPRIQQPSARARHVHRGERPGVVDVDADQHRGPAQPERERDAQRHQGVQPEQGMERDAARRCRRRARCGAACRRGGGGPRRRRRSRRRHLGAIRSWAPEVLVRRAAAAASPTGAAQRRRRAPGANPPMAVTARPSTAADVAQAVERVRRAPPAAAGSPRRRGARAPSASLAALLLERGRAGSTGSAAASTPGRHAALLAQRQRGRRTGRPTGPWPRARGRARRGRGRRRAAARDRAARAGSGAGRRWRRVQVPARRDLRRRASSRAPSRRSRSPAAAPPRVPVTTTRSPGRAPAAPQHAVSGVAEQRDVDDDRPGGARRRCRPRPATPASARALEQPVVEAVHERRA